MNTVVVNIKKNGVYERIDGVLVSIDGANLLDEQLDEARIVVKNSLVGIYPPLTEVRIDFLVGGSIVHQEYMLVAEDKPTTFNAV